MAGVVAGGELGDAERAGDPLGAAETLQRVVGDRRAQALGESLRLDRTGLAAEEGELLAADASEHRLAAQALPRDRHHFAQHLVADHVPVLVVDQLEGVEVEQHDREPIAVRARALDLPFELLFEETPVVGAGEPIASGQLEQGVVVGAPRRRDRAGTCSGRRRSGCGRRSRARPRGRSDGR